jgi:predicted nucleic acid-binding protein
VRIAIDTNVLVYAEGVNGDEMQGIALRTIAGLRQGNELFLPIQAIGELFNVMTRKAARSPDAARSAILSWRDVFSIIETTTSVMIGALDLSCDHQLSIWDATIVSGAAEGGCRLLLSEDMQDGFTWRGVTVANPFAPIRHPLLAPILTGSPE